MRWPMANLSSPALELHQAEQLLMKWPMGKRLQLKVQALREQLDRQQEAKLRTVRGRIRAALMTVDLQTLNYVAGILGCSK